MRLISSFFLLVMLLIATNVYAAKDYEVLNGSWVYEINKTLEEIPEAERPLQSQIAQLEQIVMNIDTKANLLTMSISGNVMQRNTLKDIEGKENHFSAKFGEKKNILFTLSSEGLLKVHGMSGSNSTLYFVRQHALYGKQK